MHIYYITKLVDRAKMLKAAAENIAKGDQAVVVHYHPPGEACNDDCWGGAGFE